MGPLQWTIFQLMVSSNHIILNCIPLHHNLCQMSDLDCHTLGSAGSLLSSASLSPHIYSSVNLDPSLCLLLIILCGLPSSRSSWWTGGCVAWAPLGDALSCSVVLWIHTLYITCIRLSGNVTCKL